MPTNPYPSPLGRCSAPSVDARKEEPACRSIFQAVERRTVVQIGQASLHGAREAGNPQTVQVVMAPALARDVRPDQLGCHWTHVGGLVDLGGSEERLLHRTHTGYPTQTLKLPCRNDSARTSPQADVVMLELRQRLHRRSQRPLPRLVSRGCPRDGGDWPVIFRELPPTEPAEYMRLMKANMTPPHTHPQLRSGSGNISRQRS